MDFLITNMTGFRNKGCEATTKTIVNEMAKLQENAKFEIFTEDVNYDIFQASQYKNLSFLKSPFRRHYFFMGLSCLPRWWQYRLIGKLRISPLIRRAVETFHKVDAVLSTGEISLVLLMEIY